MRTLKALLSALGVVAISSVLATSAMAATATYSAVDQTVDAVDYTPAGQTTVMIVETADWTDDPMALTADDIYYINQFDTVAEATAGLQNMGLRNPLVDGGEYLLLIGNGTSIVEIPLNYTAVRVSSPTSQDDGHTLIWVVTVPVTDMVTDALIATLTADTQEDRVISLNWDTDFSDTFEGSGGTVSFGFVLTGIQDTSINASAKLMVSANGNTGIQPKTN